MKTQLNMLSFTDLLRSWDIKLPIFVKIKMKYCKVLKNLNIRKKCFTEIITKNGHRKNISRPKEKND